MSGNTERPTGYQDGESLVDGMKRESGTQSHPLMINGKRDLESTNDDSKKSSDEMKESIQN
jgi:hypothetical protein